MMKALGTVLCAAISLFAFARAQAATAESRLRWGTLSDAGAASPSVKKYQARVVELAERNAGRKFTAVVRILSEGRLPTDPGVAESHAATRELSTILKLAVCARLTADASCRSAATQGLLEWARVYKPDGNPINENELIPLIQAWDVMKPLLSAQDEAVMEKFGRDLIAAGDSFYGGLKPTDGRYYNNWGTWRLCVRALTAAVLGDDSLVSSSRAMLADHLAHNLLPDGSSIDFHGRDALHYHVYDLQALSLIALQMPPDFVDERQRKRIESGLEFLKPFFAGEKQHIEFLHSKIPFDIKRKEAGLADYQNAPWKPEGARSLLRLARAAFPGIKPWTQSVVDEAYDPMLKLEAAARGD